MHHVKSITIQQCITVSIWGLSILYDHYVTESDKIISWSIDSKLLPYHTKVFLLQKCHFETFIYYRKHFIINTQWYININGSMLIYSIDTHVETLCITMHRCITVSSHLYLVISYPAISHFQLLVWSNNGVYGSWHS